MTPEIATETDDAPTKKVKKAKPTGPADAPAIVQPKSPGQWQTLLAAAGQSHWRVMRITIQIRERLLAGKPRDLNVANAMLKARDLEDQIEAVPAEQPARGIEAARVAENEGLCEFHRRPGKEGIWLPTNNVKAGIKENWSVLGYRREHWGSKVSLAEGTFVYGDRPNDQINAPASIEDDYIFLGAEPDGVASAVCHSEIRGEAFSSIKRNEFIEARELKFLVKIAARLAPKIPDEAFAAMLVHFGEHGLGASRSQGNGKFDVTGIEEINTPV